MIAVLHFIYWTMQQVYKFCTQPVLNGEQHFEEQYFEKSKVIYNNACQDAEIGLKFDPPVYLQRYSAVQDVLLNEKWRDKIVKVVDFGCAELKFFKYLKNLMNIQEVLLVDVDKELLTYNACRASPFNADYLIRRSKGLHVEVLQGSIDTPDPKLISVDAVICIEIIEHLYPDTLEALPHNIFHFIQPLVALFTTPNADFNQLFTNFSGIRHDDHKFEWSREQFEDWSRNIVLRYPKYSVYFVGIGPGPKGKEHLGCCSQMAVFIKNDFAEVEILGQISSLKDCVTNDDFFSFGVCTYQSYVAGSIPDKYEVIYQVDYPYEIDSRTEEEIILHDTEYRLHRLSSSIKFRNYETDYVYIPLYELTSNRGGEFISISELRTILQKAGWKIEDRNIDDIKTPCVIYELSPSPVSSPRSPSPNLNFSTEANWDSGSQWDLESAENWDEYIPKMETNSIDVWEEASAEPSSIRASENSPLSDPCVSGEQMGQTDERIELLFDSGYQVSSSSIDLSPDISKDWMTDDKKEEGILSESIRTSKSEKQCKVDEEGLNSLKKPPRKRNKKVEEAQINRAINPPVQIAEIENIVENLLENPAVVENGDLANNNRDLEGNNYQAAENIEQIDDNAIPRPENLDEHNENHIVLEEPNLDYLDDEDAAESLEDASREVLYDPNSELNLSDDFVVQGQQIPVQFDDYNLLQRTLAVSEENFRTPLGFPAWLLQMLNIHAEDLDLDEDNAHFYSQGDGVGVHPSTTEISEDSTTSTSSQTTTEREVTIPVPSLSSEEASSNYEDAVEDQNASTSRDTREVLNTDTNQTVSRDTGQK